MCCNDRIHVIVISIVCLVLSGLAALWSMVQLVQVGIYASENQSFGGNGDIFVVIQVVIHIIWITSESLCIVGALKNKKWLLVPFMICLALQILGCIVGLIFVASDFSEDGFSVYTLLYIIPLFIVLGISFYFLSIAIRFHAELNYGWGSAEHPGMSLQSYTALPYSTIE